ncbi:hypothetical protein NQ317_001076 [Molorchus minor]|uniref:Peptidase aspartic putative domain-containing protein n=1 Tax=Molorchus minor TaxID=1323400 RepID=A0ABQ9JP75_9CUCU|nr:hypothetical protein NQ317_001076 [Molorchus minor]
MLVYGREPILLTEANLMESCRSADANQIRERSLAVRAEAVKNIQNKQEKDKRRYDEKHRHLEFQEGDLVKVFSSIRKVGRSEKLLLRWFGPYYVLKKTSDMVIGGNSEKQVFFVSTHFRGKEHKQVMEEVICGVGVICVVVKTIADRELRKEQVIRAFEEQKSVQLEITLLDENDVANIAEIEEKMFLAVIDKNVDLSSIQKLFYLRNYLRGEALELIVNLPLVNDSYVEAIKLLNDRFDNQTMIINSHIYTLLDIPNVQKGTSAKLREFVSKIKQQLSALKNLGQDVEKWNMILICILSKKLDSFTNRSYQLDRDSTTLPTVDEFLQYLENRATALEAVTLPDNKDIKEKVCHVAKSHKFKEQKCQFCKGTGHKIYNCMKFKTTSVNDRISFIEINKHCKICLNLHPGRCKYSYKCATCKREHNSLLHKSAPDETNVASNIVSTHHYITKASSANVLLPTVKVKLKSADGQEYFVRGLLDSGSQTSLISSDLAKKLKCKTFTNNLNIVGIAKNVTNVQRSAYVEVHSCVYNYKLKVECAVVDTITTNLPQYHFDISNVKIPKNITLSDENFNKPGEILILLGANVFFQTLVTGTVKLGFDSFVLQNTLFGFIVSGCIPERSHKGSHDVCNTSVVSLHSTVGEENIEQLMSKFWQTEQVPEIYPEIENEQEACEVSFLNSVEKIDNRFQVKLPLKKLAHVEQETFPLAANSLLNHTYVDDVISGADSISEAIQLRNELIGILKRGSFELHKWCANNPELLQDIPIEQQHFDEVDIIKNNTIIKTLEKIAKALEDIKNGESKKSVSKKYAIPRSTLQFRLSSKFSKCRPGPNTYLTVDEETKLVEWILESQKKGFPKRKVDLQLSVKEFMDADGRPNLLRKIPGQEVVPRTFKVPNLWYFDLLLFLTDKETPRLDGKENIKDQTETVISKVALRCEKYFSPGNPGPIETNHWRGINSRTQTEASSVAGEVALVRQVFERGRRLSITYDNRPDITMAKRDSGQRQFQFHRRQRTSPAKPSADQFRIQRYWRKSVRYLSHQKCVCLDVISSRALQIQQTEVTARRVTVLDFVHWWKGAGVVFTSESAYA